MMTLRDVYTLRGWLFIAIALARPALPRSAFTFFAFRVRWGLPSALLLGCLLGGVAFAIIDAASALCTWICEYDTHRVVDNG